MLGESQMKALMDRAARSNQRFELARSRWADAYRYCLPFMDDPYGTDTESTEKGFEIYDDTALQIVPETASKLLDLIWPLFTRGWRLEPAGALSDAEKMAAQDELDEQSEKLHSMIAASNLREAIEQSFMDYMVTTAQARIDPGPARMPLKAQSLTPWQQSFERLPTGEVIGYFRRRTLTVKEIEYAYGPNNVSIPNDFRSPGRENDKLTILEATTRTDDLWSDDEEWTEHVIVQSANNARACIREETNRGFGSAPILNWGWGRRASNWWHFGPVMTILPSTVTVNTVVEFMLEHADIAIGGIWQMPVTNGVNVDNITLQAGTIIPYRGDTRGLENIANGGDLRIGELLSQGLQERIRDGLMNEDFRGRGDTPISSREVAARQARDSQRSASPFSRMMRECLIPMVARCVWIGKRKGLIDLPDGWEMGVNVQPISPQARQYRMEDVSQTMDWIGAMNNTLGPTKTQLLVNADEVAKHMAWAYEQPSRFMNTMDQQRQAMADLEKLMPATEDGAMPPAGMPGAPLQ